MSKTRVKTPSQGYKIVTKALCHYPAIKKLEDKYLNNKASKKFKEELPVISKLKGKERVVESVKKSLHPAMTVDQTQKHIDLLDFQHKFVHWFPAAPVVQPFGWHEAEVLGLPFCLSTQH